MKTGWVIKWDNTYVGKNGETRLAKLREADVFPTRKEARKERWPFLSEKVFKVALNKYGKPYKIIGRG